MKLLHIPAKSGAGVLLPASALKKLPKKLGIVATVQHLHKISDVVNQTKGILAGQVLGCNASAAEKVASKVDAFLFVGSGEFHPVNVALKTGKPVWLWNPVSKRFGLLNNNVVEDSRRKNQGRLAKFLFSKCIGVIVSAKMGQKNLARAYELVEQSDKDCYLFACDSVDIREFENFPFVEFWVNTACPRISDDSVNLINIDDLVDAGLLKLKKSSCEVPIWKSRL